MSFDAVWVIVGRVVSGLRRSSNRNVMTVLCCALLYSSFISHSLLALILSRFSHCVNYRHLSPTYTSPTLYKLTSSSLR